MNRLRLNILILMFFSFSGVLLAQGFKGIIPLVSTCDDIKHILQVEKCTVPFSVYFLKDFSIDIHFEKEKPSESDKQCYRVPAGTVTSFTVSYNKPFPIKDFEYELKYKEGPFGDIDTTVYKNPENGVYVLVNLGRINTAIFTPTPEQNRKFLYDCKVACKQD